MEYSIPENMSREEVSKLIQRVKTLTGAEINLKINFALVTDDKKAQGILSVLLDAPKPAEFNTEQAAKKTQPQSQLPMSETESSKTWEVIDENKQVVERLSIEEKATKLAYGQFQEGQRLRYSKNGKYFTVKGAPGKTQQLHD